MATQDYSVDLARSEDGDKIVRIAGNAGTVVSTLREALELSISWRRA